MQATRHDPGVFELRTLGGFRQPIRHLCWNQRVLVSGDEEHWLLDFVDFVDTLPSQSKHGPLDRLNQSQEAEQCVCHIADRSESVLDYDSFYVVVSLLVKL